LIRRPVATGWVAAGKHCQDAGGNASMDDAKGSGHEAPLCDMVAENATMLQDVVRLMKIG
jgi:hypothetical protein